MRSWSSSDRPRREERLGRRARVAHGSAGRQVGVLALFVGVAGVVPASAATATYTYDTAAYAYDGPARLASPEAVARDARGSPSRSEAVSWGRSVFVARFGVAANTAVPIAEGNAAHMLRDALGHLAEDTLANRALLQETVSPGNLVRTSSLGPNGILQTFERTLPNGDVVWVEVRNGTAITNGGVNVAP